MKIDLHKLKKVEPSSLSMPSANSEDEFLEVIVKVNQANYIPPDIQVRSQIDPYMFTCLIASKLVSKLEDDPQVVSFALNQKYRVI